MNFLWVTINVKDMEESLNFYQEILGLKLNRKLNPLPGTEIAFLGNGGTEVELIRNVQNGKPQYGNDISMGFSVKSLDEEIKRLKKTGVKDIQGPFQPNPTIKFIYITDPNGVKIQLVESAT
ncbi:MAG: VOC family protein [Spirochaetales bacterium]|nr:VOC family protein [Spirochaetales bacterium]